MFFGEGGRSCSKYQSCICLVAQVCDRTDGTIANTADATTSTVRLVWERIWWQPRGDAHVPPTDPDAEGAAALRPLVQAIGIKPPIED